MPRSPGHVLYDRLQEVLIGAARIIVYDIPGEPIALTLYNQAEAVATIALPPIRALALAGELIRAAMPRVREAAWTRYPAGPIRRRQPARAATPSRSGFSTRPRTRCAASRALAIERLAARHLPRRSSRQGAPLTAYSGS